MWKLVFFTDCEGDFGHFSNCVEDSEVLCWANAEKDRLEFRDESGDSRFVFGGDAFDRGNADLRIGRLLVSFKKRFPSRVVLLMGNRDINKMRFTSELECGDVPAADAFHAFWDPRAPTLTEYLTSNNLEDSPMARLKWMLAHTLGCPNTFELRREELQLERGGAGTGTTVDDAAVFRSFVDACGPDGVYTQYLRRAQLAYVLDDVLFVHGAANGRALGFVPDTSIRFAPNESHQVTGRLVADVQLWVRELNAYAQRCLDEWQQNPRWDAEGRRGGDSLMAYQNKPAMHRRTVCVTNYVDGKNMPETAAFDPNGHRKGFDVRADPFDAHAVDYLKRGGISRICVGHTPSGEAPATLNMNGLTIVSADTNYAVRQGNGRGGSCCVATFTPQETWLKGRLADRRGSFNCLVQDPIGTKIDGWWVKLRMPDGRLLLSRGQGRNSESKFIEGI